MRKTTDLKPDQRERREKLRVRLGLAAALTSPFWIVALLIDGPLSHRLLGAAILLLISVCVLYSYRWVAYVAGVLWAVGQRMEEKKKGEGEHAKKY